ncbi:G protein-coupled receptor gpr1 [Saitoella coloradoensis]
MSFRHQLIFLLFVSDFCKAAWEMIFPAVALSRGMINAESSFCQAAGFFSETFIEATDFAVFVIALHTALYVFLSHKQTGKEGGLYSYRGWVFTMWALLSILLASLVFAGEGYVPLPNWCYIPVKPIAWRMALSWGPRFFIIGFVLVLYLALYIYVKSQFRSIRKDLHRHSLLSEDLPEPAGAAVGREGRQPSQDAGVAMLDTHGLLGDVSEEAPAQPPQSKSTSASERRDSNFGAITLSSRQTSSAPLELPVHAQDSAHGSTPSPFPLDIPAAEELTLGPFPGQQQSDPTTTSAQQASLNQPLTPMQELHKRHLLVIRQLRLLFIYPIVYLFLWIIPLVLYIFQLSSASVTKPIFVLHTISSGVIPMHGFVDVMVFVTKEKPYVRVSQWIHDKRYGGDPTGGDRKGSTASVGSTASSSEGNYAAQVSLGHSTNDAYLRRMDEDRQLREERNMREERRERARRKGSMSAEAEARWWDKYDLETGLGGEVLTAGQGGSSSTVVTGTRRGEQLEDGEMIRMQTFTLTDMLNGPESRESDRLRPKR